MGIACEATLNFKIKILLLAPQDVRLDYFLQVGLSTYSGISSSLAILNVVLAGVVLSWGFTPDQIYLILEQCITIRKSFWYLYTLTMDTKRRYLLVVSACFIAKRFSCWGRSSIDQLLQFPTGSIGILPFCRNSSQIFLYTQ